MTSTDEIFDLGCRRVDRIKSATKNHKIDSRKALQRDVAEEISRGFSKYMPIPHLVTGGLIYPQFERETGDLDVLFARPPEVIEVQKAFHSMRSDMMEKGLVFESYSKEPEALWIGGNLGQRHKIVVMAGDTRINLHIDVTGGSHLFPRRPQTVRIGSTFFKGQEPLTAYYQDFESHAADKIHAIMTRSDSTRWKDWDDLNMLWDKRLSPETIALELVHKLRRSHPTETEVMALLVPSPSQFGLEFAQEKAADWERWQGKNRSKKTDFINSLDGARKLYNAVQKAVQASFEAEKKVERRPRRREKEVVNIMPPEMKARLMASKTRRDKSGKVVDIDAYRDEKPGYRPKF